MKKSILRLVGIALLGAIIFWCWRTFFPSPEQVVRERLAELARLASFSSSEAPMAKMWNAQELGGLFTTDVEVSVDSPGGLPRTFSGRDTLVEHAAAARSALDSLRVEFPDISVTIGPDGQSATAYVTANAKISREKDPFVQELKFTFQKTGRDWLIRRVETSKTLSELREPDAA